MLNTAFQRHIIAVRRKDRDQRKAQIEARKAAGAELTDAVQRDVCKAIAVSCMWGQGGIASVILDKLEKTVPGEKRWRKVYTEVAECSRREAVGTIASSGELMRLLSDGYFLCNHNEHGCSLHRPSRYGGGLHKYVSKTLADSYQQYRANA